MSFFGDLDKPLLEDDSQSSSEPVNSEILSMLSKYSSAINRVDTVTKALSIEDPNTKTNATARSRMHTSISVANSLTKCLYAAFKSDSNSLSSLLQSSSESDLNGESTTTHDAANIAVNSTLNYGKKMIAGKNRAARANHNKLRRDFQQEMMRLEKIIKLGEEMEREIVMRISSVSRGSNASVATLNSTIDTMDESHLLGGDDSDENDVALSGAASKTYKAQDFSSALVSERNREIEQIQGSMIKVNEVYNDLANLVDEQQIEIDDIEQNILASHERAQAGFTQLEKATNFQKSSGRCMRWLLAIVLVGALIAIGVLYGPQIMSSKK
ncbi:hypothetical protein TrLO_g7714 [Triparma laevis f. longispina]|uniref:t-SNARE coiled-coil homology domain-containing protein n=1 Tax=Triparma laevis f. longispina TaxID=1714387 RepID=A0A9W7EJA8_9STRA|nr:hypothetical protein TrLO_g7714 [Triparma laevis f. longispina]